MTAHSSTAARDELSEVVLDIAHQQHPADMIDRVAQLAARLVECAAADLIRPTGNGELVINASSDPPFSELTTRAWRRWPHPPILPLPAAADAAAILQRTSYLQQLRTDTGIVQELIVPLAAGRTDHGYLRFLFTEPRLEGADRAVIAAFCAHASIALDRAALLVHVTQLRLALDSNRIIGAAVGVLMARHGLTYPEGLDRLTTASQNANRRLYAVASDVLLTGQLPVARTRRPATSVPGYMR